MSLVGEIVVREGNEDLNVDGWRVCSFLDEDVNGNEFTNFEVAYWRGGGIEWASLNNCLNYFSTLSDALDWYEDAVEGVCI
jgi:hypothetical protein